MNETFKSERAPEPVGAFPHAKRVGGLLFLSGIGPRVRGSKEIPGVTLDSSGNVVSYDIETQCRAVFENVRLVLEDAGATWQDIIDVTVFLTDMKNDFPIYNRIYAEHFAGHAFQIMFLTKLLTGEDLGFYARLAGGASSAVRPAGTP